MIHRPLHWEPLWPTWLYSHQTDRINCIWRNTWGSTNSHWKWESETCWNFQWNPVRCLQHDCIGQIQSNLISQNCFHSKFIFSCSSKGLWSRAGRSLLSSQCWTFGVLTTGRWRTIRKVLSVHSSKGTIAHVSWFHGSVFGKSKWSSSHCIQYHCQRHWTFTCTTCFEFFGATIVNMWHPPSLGQPQWHNWKKTLNHMISSWMKKLWPKLIRFTNNTLTLPKHIRKWMVLSWQPTGQGTWCGFILTKAINPTKAEIGTTICIPLLGKWTDDS